MIHKIPLTKKAVAIWTLDKWKSLHNSKVLPILGIALAVAVSVSVIINREQIAQLGTLGYPSIFFITMIWNSTVFFPFPVGLLYFSLGSIFPIAPLAIAGGAGAAVGELVSYLTGRSGRAILGNKKWGGKMYPKVERWVNRWGIIIVFAFNLQPILPFDLVGLAAGSVKFPLWKYYLACLAGRSCAYAIIAYLGSQGYLPPLPFIDMSSSV